MAVRFTDTELWGEDWYWNLGGEYQLFCKYIFDKCDNAGVWKLNKNDFEMKSKFKINLDSFLAKMNEDKERIIVLENGRWFILGFIKFQWFNKKNAFVLNLANKLHNSLYNLLLSNDIPLEKVRGLKEVLKTSRDRERDYLDNTGFIQDITEEEVKEKPYVYLDTTIIRPPQAPTYEIVWQYFYGQGKTEKDAKEFFNHYEGLGWRKGMSPIMNWRSFANNWISNIRPTNKANTDNQGYKLDVNGQRLPNI